LRRGASGLLGSVKIWSNEVRLLYAAGLCHRQRSASV